MAWPVDCTLGQDCFIEDYVDQDPEPGRQRDFACGYNARDGHKGTDIALLDFDAIAEGVAVTAAAPGLVLRTRDEMPDDRLMRGVTDQTACGNAVLVEHADGWRTLYCHLRLGSVAVAPGDIVRPGDRLGSIGLSGRTNHPHLHLQVSRDGALVDPFRPGAALGTCGTAGDTLWQNPPGYVRTGLFTARFSNRVPGFDEVRAGTAPIDVADPMQPLVVYAIAQEAQTGDRLTLSGEGPEGRIFFHSLVLDAPQRSQLQAYGRKAPDGGWPPGDYLGRAMLTRDGQVIAHRFAHVTVTP
ncbi:M23 family metallopeptidase [Pseudoponticoccus marisrubri]|uniref:M23 family metallopeptidase n=1 Tax=Pseudoponticoccus marisrubri TaxID=1685382 RepID=UPI001F0B3939|nr:M23 family metallopeptidase [Pseudoponticoccus marisrubri]